MESYHFNFVGTMHIHLRNLIVFVLVKMTYIHLRNLIILTLLSGLHSFKELVRRARKGREEKD